MTEHPVPPLGRYHCPSCGVLTAATGPCPGCGRRPDPQAARLVALDAELTSLRDTISVTSAELTRLTDSYRALDLERRTLAQAMITAVVAERSATVSERIAAAPDPTGSPQPVRDQATPAGSVGASTPWPGAERLGTPDASPRTVQNLLFVLGAALLGIGAIVFTVVAWARYGAVGRVTILGTATLVALAIPLIAVRRRLVATAETFTALGLLLVGLDGYGIRRLNVFGFGDRLSGTTYAAIVLAVLSLIALGYGIAVGLAGPRIVALIVAQPVLPLLTVSRHPGLVLFGAAFAVLAAIDFAAAGATTARLFGPVVRILGLVFGSLALAEASLSALARILGGPQLAHLLPAAALEGAAAMILFVVASRASSGLVRAAGIALAGWQIEIAVAATVAKLWPGHPLAAVAGVTAATVVVAVLVRSRVRLATGVTVSAWVTTGLLGVGTVADTVLRVASGVVHEVPLWRADLHDAARVGALHPSHPAAIMVAFIGAALLADHKYRQPVTLLGIAPFVLALGRQPGLPWWGPAAVDVAGILLALLLSLVALRRTLRSAAAVAGAGAGVLAIHAVIASLVRPGLTAAVTGAVAVAGFATVGALWRRIDRDRPSTALAGGALAAAIASVPIALASFTAVFATGPIAPMRAALASAAAEVALLYALRQRSSLRPYGVSALIAITVPVSITPLVFSSTERVAIYAMTGRLIIGLAVLAVGFWGRTGRLAATPGDVIGLLALGRIGPIVVTVIGAPYTWLGSIWTGAPDGVGLSPAGVGLRLDALDVATAVLFTGSIVATAATMRGWTSAIALGVHPAIVSVLVIVAASGAPWPLLPIVALLIGVGAVLWSGVFASLRLTMLHRRRPFRLGYDNAIGWTGLVVAGSGLAGLTATKISTLCALAVAFLVAALVGAGGRPGLIRVGGLFGAVTAANLFVDAMIRAGGFGFDAVWIGTLAVSAVVSGAAPLARHWERHRIEVLTLDIAAHAGAFVALILSGSLWHAATCAVVWGLLVALRSLWPEVSVDARRLLIAAGLLLEALAWWLMAAEWRVHLIDAYTLPAAAVALVAGWLAARSRPELGSWATYGTALVAAFLPSVVPALGPNPSAIRQLAVGVAAIAVAVIGGQSRLRAPVIVGGMTALALALRDLAYVWQSLPAWIPLSAAGLLVIAFAITYERRRRDWLRMRSALSHLT